MALASSGLVYYPEIWTSVIFGSGFSTSANYVMDSTTIKQAALFTVPKSGTVTAVAFSLQAVTTDQQIRVSLQTVDGSGFPTGTNYGTSTPGDDAITLTANVNLEVTLGASTSVTVGDTLAIVFEWVSTQGSIRIGLGNASPFYGFSKPLRYTSSWITGTGAVAACLKYDDGTYGSPSPFAIGGVSRAYNANTATADEYGLRINLPFKCRASGIWVIGSSATTASNVKFGLYSNSGTVEVASVSVDPQVMDRAAAAGPSLVLFSTPQVLTPGVYYVSVQPQSTTNNWTFACTLVGSVAQFETWPGGVGCYQVTRLNNTTWTEVNTEYTPMGLIIDQLDDGASAGSVVISPFPGQTALLTI